MAKRKNKGTKINLFSELKEETKHSVLAVVFFVLGVFFILSAWDKSGVVGSFIFKILDTLLGVGFFILPLVMFILGISFLRSIKHELVLTKILGGFFFFLSGLGITTLIFKNGAGGIIGKTIATPLNTLFDFYASLVFLIAVLVISLLLMLDTKLSIGNIKLPFKKKDSTDDKEHTEEEYEDSEEENEEDNEDAEEDGDDEYEKNEEEVEEKNDNEEEEIKPREPILPLTPYKAPPLSLLNSDKGKPGVGDIRANANIIKRTLLNFGITVEMDEISVGPSVTRYSLKPAEGVKLSRIVGLQNDLGLALAAHPIRIEAPIPGKSLVGIEVPNSSRSMVGLAGLLSSPDFQQTDKFLPFALGKGISGKSCFADLAKIPHILIAGATGSGKSVTIHAIVNSLIFKNSPDNLRFIMIDPKRVELTLYNKIPHLLTPVVTDPKKAILALKWAAKEMDRRYDILETESVRDISSYHKNIVAPAYKKADGKDMDEDFELPEKMPYIVVMIDELADIMATYPRELESSIVRLAQMSRAVGIHLVLSTQRPSVNVITGLIKANIPGRIALQVSSQIDSRTILDGGGAEKLLGAGDMLYISGEMSQPRRIQSAFVSEGEVKKIVGFLSKQYEDELPSEINLTTQNNSPSIFDTINDSDSNEDEDELYEEARETVIQAGKASTSYLQRKLKIGYSRAARLMDILEEKGVIGHADGSKPREILSSDTDGYGEDENIENNEDK